MNEPWPDTESGVMWTYHDRDRWGRATRTVRNDALWERLTMARTANIERAREWCAAAIADGWNATPTYPEHEPMESAFTLERDGYKILGLARAGDNRTLPCASLHIWGPDRLAINPPLTYDMDAIRRGAETYSKCGAHPIATERVGFAGRYCGTCAPIVRPSIETRGWTE